MGITGLLPILKPTLRKRHIRSFQNKRVGIDGYAWLYPILNFVAEEMYMNIPTKKHIQMFENKIKQLMYNKIIPVVIFDGDSLVSKEKTNMERRLSKEKYKKEVELLLSKNMYKQAKKLMKRCITVSRKVVYDISILLRKLNIEYIIAPYEADSQLYYLETIKYIDYIMTEDSDLIPFGCQNILFKFDNSYVDHYTIDCLKRAKDSTFQEYIQDICILSGCDYADSIPGIGVLTAHKLILKNKTIDEVIESVKIKKKVSENYLEKFNLAKITFNHQIVYDPILKIRKYLKPLEVECELLGTLEDVKYGFSETENGILNLIGNKEIYIDRHFKPSEEGLEITLKPIETPKKVLEDKNTVSPYFAKL